MTAYRIPLVIDSWGEAERAAAHNIIDGDRQTMGEHVARFESEFAQLVNAKHAVMVTSGSMALLLAAFWYAEHVGRYKVVVPAVTWPTTAWSFIQAGCRVIFADVDPETFVMENGEHDGFAHVPVHLMGNKCSITNKMRVIEDSCEAIQPLSGTLACYSMYFSHHMNTVEGGMVCTNDQATADWLVSCRGHGWIRGRSDMEYMVARYPEFDRRFMFVTQGFNMKPTELAAAVGLVQLARLPKAMEERLHAYLYMAEKLAGLANQVVPMRLVSNPAPFAFPLLCRDAATKARLVIGLEAGENIETRPIAGGNLTRQPAFQKHNGSWTAGSLPGANKIHDCGFFIGLYPGMDCDYVVDSIKRVLG